MNSEEWPSIRAKATPEKTKSSLVYGAAPMPRLLRLGEKRVR
jgi:hypothetical protein